MPSDCYTCTKFDVDSSIRFPVTVQTNRQTNKQTDATKRPMHAGDYAGVGKNEHICTAQNK